MLKLNSPLCLFRGFLAIIIAFAIWLMIALISFNPSDSSWSQSNWHEPIHNLCGIVGAWIADIFFFIFGLTAYIIPFIVIISCIFIWHQKKKNSYINYFSTSFHLIGILIFILTSCEFATINVDNIWYFFSGGIIGSLLNTVTPKIIYSIKGKILLMCIWITSLTIFTGLSWIKIIKKISGIILNILIFSKSFFWYNNVLINNKKYKSDKRKNECQNNKINDINQNFWHSYISCKMKIYYKKNFLKKIKNWLSYIINIILFLKKQKDGKNHTKHGSASAVFNISLFSKKILFSNKIIEKSSCKEDCKKSYNFSLNQFLFVSSTDEFSSFSFRSVMNGIHKEKIILRRLTLKNKASFRKKKQESLVISKINGHFTFILRDIKKQFCKLKLDTIFSENIYHRSPKIRYMPKIISKAELLEISTGNDSRQIKSLFYHFKTPKRKKNNQSKKLFTQYQFIQDLEKENESKKINFLVGSKSFILSRTGNLINSFSKNIKNVRQAALLNSNYIRSLIHKTLNFNNISFFNNNIHKERILKQNHCYHINIRNQRKKEKSVPQCNISNNDHHLKEKSFESSQFSLINRFSPIKDLLNEEINAPLFTPSILSTSMESLHQSYTFASPQCSSKHCQKLTIFSKYRCDENIQESLTQSFSIPENNVQFQKSNLKECSVHSIMDHDNIVPLQKSTVMLPSLDLLISPPLRNESVDSLSLEQIARLLETRLEDFHIKANVVNYSPGPVITRFELNLAPGVKVARISNLSRDLARSLSAVSVRIVEVIPGKPYVGLELPNKKRQIVYLRDLIDNTKFRKNLSPLTIALGKDIVGKPVIANLSEMPHLLVAGTTGSGKSVAINAIIISILYKAMPEDVRFIMIDPKMLELSVYEGIPHLLTEVITDMNNAANALQWSVNEMERRYKLMSILGVRNIISYNERITEIIKNNYLKSDFYSKIKNRMDIQCPIIEKFPYIVLLVDEFADLMITVGKKVEKLIARLAQKARAAGIHLVLATQRPSVDVITGLIKANIPTRIAFTVSSKTDSRTILDQNGAESLLGMGDMLYSGPNSTIPIRIHGAFVHDQEVHAVVKDWKLRGHPKYVNEISFNSNSKKNNNIFFREKELDPLFKQIMNFVIEKRKISISGIQRKFHIGYNRAARIIDQMEEQGIVSKQKNNNNRKLIALLPFE